MNGMPSNDPVVQQLQLLLTGYGYNFYSATNMARSDDMLVREKASNYLTQAADMLATMRGAYQRRFIPPLTRANPDPPQEALARVREIGEVQQALGNVETHIRGMAVPNQDRIWWRIRHEEILLTQLLGFDLALVRASEQVYQTVTQITPERWQSHGGTQLTYSVQQVVQIARDRERFLLLPT